MRTFNIFQHPSQGEEAVKVGFSWPCLLFGVLWAISKRLWGLAALIGAAILVATCLELMLESVLTPQEMLPISLVINLGFMIAWVAVAVMGNEMRQRNLHKRGYAMVATLQAATPEAALAKVKNEGLVPVLCDRDGLTV